MNIRFRELVKKAGQPEEKSLWTDPKRDREFQKAVKENRVLTIVQQPTAKKKEFGEIGFHEQRYATYLVFPKRLPAEADAKVIGIDYALIGHPEVHDAIDSSKIHPTKSAKAMTVKAAAVAAARKPVLEEPKAKAPKRKPLERFEVLIRRTAILETTVVLEAKSKSQAKENAIASAKSERFDVSKAVVRTEAVTVKS